MLVAAAQQRIGFLDVAGRAPDFAASADLQAPAHHGPVDPASFYRRRPRRRRCRSGCLADRRGSWRRRLRYGAGNCRCLVWPPAAFPLGLRAFLSSVQWHPASDLGCRSRPRFEKRLCHRLDRRCRLARADGHLLYRRLRLSGGRALMADTRSAAARVRGLGSAHEGVKHWWLQRVTALLLIPLVIWFVIGLVIHTGADHAAAVAWLGHPVTYGLMVVLLGA